MVAGEVRSGANGNLVTTYESSAEHYSDDGSDWGWVPGVPDDDDLWANPYLTVTPLSALGLGADFEVQPGTLREASHALDRPSTQPECRQAGRGR